MRKNQISKKANFGIREKVDSDLATSDSDEQAKGNILDNSI